LFFFFDSTETCSDISNMNNNE